MTEFAYSELDLTPLWIAAKPRPRAQSAVVRRQEAVSVGRWLRACAGCGDTHGYVGPVRIPAAFLRLVGFKTVPAAQYPGRCIPLSKTL